MIQPFNSDDLSALPKLQPEGWTNSITPAFNYYLESPFCFPFKYVVDGNVAGTGCGINYGETAWLAHIIVNKNYRRRGIALKIVNHIKNYLFNMSVKTISLIATEMGEPVYIKAGFTDCCEYNFYSGECSLDFEVSKNIVPYNKRYIRELLAFDSKHTGENRNIILNNLDITSLYIKNNSIEGYYIPNLGQGHIIAENNEAGIELMKLRLKDCKEFVLPSTNKAGTSFLEEIGLSKTVSAKRMFIGKPLNVKPENIYNRIAGNKG